METIVNFFTLRPVFTFFGLRVAWYLYLLNVVVQTYVSISNIFQALAQRGIHVDVANFLGFFPLLLGLIAQLVVVRLLLEVAAIVISASPTSKS